MSVEAISWALNLAPVPRDGGGKRNPACKAVLVGLASHASPDGKDAYPSVRRLARYTDLSERTVRTALDRLEASGIIRPCDPAVVAAKIKRADQRPQGWDLAMHLVRDDLDAEDLAGLEGQFPGLTARVMADRTAAGEQPGSTNGRPGTRMRPHPAPGRPVDNQPDGVQQLHPVTGTGCNPRRNGVQSFPQRGAAAAPEPSFEPSPEPPAAPAGPPEAPPAVHSPGEAADQIGKFFAALGPRWLLTTRQRARLAPAAEAALAAGWAPDTLAAFAGANTDGVRSPYAVLRSRLSPGELPAPPPRQPSRPPWCGTCDEQTRMLDYHGDAPRPCPRCKPPSTAVIASVRPGAAVRAGTPARRLPARRLGRAEIAAAPAAGNRADGEHGGGDADPAAAARTGPPALRCRPRPPR